MGPGRVHGGAVSRVPLSQTLPYVCACVPCMSGVLMHVTGRCRIRKVPTSQPSPPAFPTRRLPHTMPPHCSSMPHNTHRQGADAEAVPAHGAHPARGGPGGSHTAHRAAARRRRAAADAARAAATAAAAAAAGGCSRRRSRGGGRCCRCCSRCCCSRCCCCCCCYCWGPGRGCGAAGCGPGDGAGAGVRRHRVHRPGEW